MFRISSLRYVSLVLASISCIVSGFSKEIVIKSPGYFKEPIRDSQPLFPDSLVFSSDAEEIKIPDISMFGQFRNYDEFPNLRRITFGNVDYLPGGLVSGLPNLEEIVFEGIIGHFDCTFISHCPKLKSVVFKGPVSSTGGPGLVYNLPNLEKVVFESVVVDFGIDYDTVYKCPKLPNFTNNGAFLKTYYDSQAPAATIDQLKGNRKLIADMERLAKWQSEVLRAKNSGWMRKTEYESAKTLLPILAKLGSAEAANLKSALEYAWNLGDDVKSELEILKGSPAYARDTSMNLHFRYADPSYSLLALSRG